MNFGDIRSACQAGEFEEISKHFIDMSNAEKIYVLDNLPDNNKEVFLFLSTCIRAQRNVSMFADEIPDEHDGIIFANLDYDKYFYDEDFPDTGAYWWNGDAPEYNMLPMNWTSNLGKGTQRIQKLFYTICDLYLDDNCWVILRKDGSLEWGGFQT